MVAAASLLAAACADSTEPVTPPPAAVARVEVNPNIISLVEGETRTVTAQAFSATGEMLQGRSVSWTSREASVAEVDAAGRVTAKAPGSAVVTAVIEDRRADVAVTVTRVPVDRIAVSPTGIVLELGKTRQLVAFVFDAAGKQLTDRVVTWHTDSPAVTTVSAAGLIAAAGPGYATIIATSEGKTFSVAVTVTDGEDDEMPYDLVYHRTTATASGEIIILGTAAMSTPFRVNAGNVSRQPTASPNGNRIAFYVSQRELTGEQTDDIFAVDRNGLNIKRLTSEPGFDGEPAWSPVGDRIAYRRIDPATGRGEIWTMNADGSDKKNLTADLPAGESAGTPSWSPFGQRIAYATIRSGFAGYTTAIWTMSADGTDKRLITSSLNGGDRSPTWSPDGSQLAFIRGYADDTDITLVNATGGSTTRLTLPGRQESPSWSPDGRHFAYWQPIGFSGGTAAYTVRVDGTNVRLHTADPAWRDAYDPEWIKR
jgi:TolB protein